MTRRVAIIGAASRFPGTTQATLWDDLLAGKDMVTEVAPGQESPGHELQLRRRFTGRHHGL